jgi:hypothetical protein
MRYQLASDKVIGKVVDDEAVVINLETGLYYGIDGLGAKAWDWLAAGVTSGEISRAIAARYPDQAQIERDVAGFIDGLSAAGLLSIAPAGDGPALPADIAWPEAFSPLEMITYDDVAEMVALDPPLPELSHHQIAR